MTYDDGQWDADDARDMTEQDERKARDAKSTTRTPAKAADVLGALFGTKD